jgi:hypothetical protein
LYVDKTDVTNISSVTIFLKEKALIIIIIIDIICQARVLWKRPQLVDEFLSKIESLFSLSLKRAQLERSRDQILEKEQKTRKSIQ